MVKAKEAELDKYVEEIITQSADKPCFHGMIANLNPRGSLKNGCREPDFYAVI